MSADERNPETAAEGPGIIVSYEAFRRFWFRYSECDEARTRAWVAENPEHYGDCTKQPVTCMVCFLETMEEEIREFWPMLVKEAAHD